MKFFEKIKSVFIKDETYEKGLTKAREEINSKFTNINKKYKKVSVEYFDELEEILLGADIGLNETMQIVDNLKKRVKKDGITDTEDLKEIIVDEMFLSYVGNDVITDKLKLKENGLTVILVVGVNGVGKTTSIGKIAYLLKKKGMKVMLCAGDTFRAGAIEQLKEWGIKIGVPVYSKEGADPASVVFDAIKEAKDKDVLLIDTAGRLQNKVNLMNELEKINKVINTAIPNEPSETLLVIDATTGQNAISQAQAFKEITNITGLVLTKLDGTARGGIVLAIKKETGLPVKYIGLGESAEDLKVFDIEKYIYGLFKDF
jgi:fused signal recognition particle receptor